MIVKIKKQDGELAEWAIIELQGDLTSRTDRPLNGQFIGDLHFTTTGTPILIIGHHILYGKEIRLEKPYAVLERRRHNADGRETNRGMTEVSAKTDYIVRSLVRKKLVFRVRPKPIIANVPKTN